MTNKVSYIQFTHGLFVFSPATRYTPQLLGQLHWCFIEFYDTFQQLWTLRNEWDRSSQILTVPSTYCTIRMRFASSHMKSYTNASASRLFFLLFLNWSTGLSYCSTFTNRSKWRFKELAYNSSHSVYSNSRWLLAVTLAKSWRALQTSMSVRSCSVLVKRAECQFGRRWKTVPDKPKSPGAINDGHITRKYKNPPK